ncbi:MAG: hypothetical protein JWL90_1737 [Chthoniobacteraceae bacterium]|nr:hypothetical protein [Chthoniobacteraceae bacterium]
MKISRSLLIVLIGFSAACDRKPKAHDANSERRSEETRQADERRISELRALEQRAAEREVASQAAVNDADRQKIESERAAVNREKVRLAEAQRHLGEQRDAQLRENDRQAEQRREDERLAAVERAKRDAAQDARAAQKIDFFYDALDPFGDWIEMEKYGYVWQPREAQNPRWRPYTDGNWAWTNYGWTWTSKEPFGWAAYHYGRWAHVKRIGWVWVPGSEWAPAWVAWRRGENHIGWAPLPPDAHSGSGFTAAVDRDYDIGPGSYSFVPVENFGEPTYVGQLIEPERNLTIINQTVNVTRVTYRTVENKSVVYNAGPEINLIDARSRQPVRQLTVEKVAGQGPSVQKGNVLQLAAPIVPTNAKPAAAPAKVKEHAKATEVDNGWSGGGDAQAIQKVRAKMNQEANAVVQKPASAEIPVEPAPNLRRVREITPAPKGNSDPEIPKTEHPSVAPVRPPTLPVTKSPFSRPPEALEKPKSKEAGQERTRSGESVATPAATPFPNPESRPDRPDAPPSNSEATPNGRGMKRRDLLPLPAPVPNRGSAISEPAILPNASKPSPGGSPATPPAAPSKPNTEPGPDRPVATPSNTELAPAGRGMKRRNQLPTPPVAPATPNRETVPGDASPNASTPVPDIKSGRRDRPAGLTPPARPDPTRKPGATPPPQSGTPVTAQP